MAALNLANSFASFDKEKLIKLAKFYPQDFTTTDLVQLSSQLNMFIVEVRNDIGHVHLVYNPYFSACFFSRNNVFLSQQISQQCFSAGLSV
jgi:hypothetical protein